MSASHFFVGLGAGVAILTVPVLTLTPGLDVPGRLEAWINGPPPQVAQVTSDNAAADRPLRGYRPGDPTPTPAPEAPPTLQPISLQPTPIPPQPASVLSSSVVSLQNARWSTTGVIHANGSAVYVRSVPDVDSGQDPMIADGSPVLISAQPPENIGGRQWIGIRGLNGVIGWVEVGQVAVDGQTPPALTMAEAAAPAPAPASSPSLVSATDRATIANTDGAGVVLRKSPNDADRTTSGLMDGTGVTVLERAGTDWLHVRSDNGKEGWVPAQYVVATG
jgi:SH3-like domain-containing protein